jgi:hypothetical protein
VLAPRAWVLALALGLPAAARAQVPRECATIELTLPSADSMIAAVRQPMCGALRVVITRAPQRVVPGMGIYMPERTFTFEVAVENAGDTAIRVPIRMEAERLLLVKYGRVHPVGVSFPYGSVTTFRGGELQVPWRFTAPEGGESLLAPGARSTPATIGIGTMPLATGFLLTLRDGPERPRPSEPLGGFPSNGRRAVALDQAAQRLIDATAFPRQRTVRELFTDSARALQFFSVTYGQGQDCPGGCFYSTAIGIRSGARVGWLHVRNYESDTALAGRLARGAFHLTPEDDHLLSEELAGALERPVFNEQYELRQVLRSISVASPRIPRERLVKLVEAQYSGFSQVDGDNPVSPVEFCAGVPVWDSLVRPRRWQVSRGDTGPPKA